MADCFSRPKKVFSSSVSSLDTARSVNLWGAQMNMRTTTLGMELLESRALPSGFNWGALGALFNPSPAVQADLAKIETDLKALYTETKTLAPTLKADEQALQTATANAIKNDTTVSSAETTLKTAITTWEATLKADLLAVKDATSSSTRKTAITQLQSDLTAAATAIKTDRAAVQTAINADSGVQAAQAKLTTDSAPITADQATLKADYAQLQKDLQAEAGTFAKWS
jgi:hypothetical protein